MMFQRLDTFSGKNPTVLGPVDRASLYHQTPEVTQGRAYEPNITGTELN
jgi:hypothetical protein